MTNKPLIITSKVKCPNCHKVFNENEAASLKMVYIDPKNVKYGKTRVCSECGAKFSDRKAWRTIIEKVLCSHCGIKAKIEVSTVDLVFEHEWSNGSRYFYETMIFPMLDSQVEIDAQVLERYKTEEEAVKGHKKWLKKIETAKIIWNKFYWRIEIDK
ncbi:MAG: hypothetical protein ACTSPL_04120 [Candidatus Odinarchaeia archaeon]